MRISHVEIQNFRALHSVSTPLSQFSVLLGENDVGKTSFLYALDRFFAGKKINAAEDFFKHKTDRDITIKITLADLADDERLAEIMRSDRSVSVRRTFTFGKSPVAKAIMEDGTTKEVDKGVLQQYFSSESFHFIPVRRDLAIQFSMNKTALLGKTFRAKMRQAIEASEAAASVSQVENLLLKSLDGPKTDLQRFLIEQLHNEEIRLGLEDLTVDPIEGVSFNMTVSDDRVDDVLVENRGAGTQNNLILALFRLVASLDIGAHLIFAMEEPENSLHPKAQRQLLSVLQNISLESQVIVTTHSPVFLERSKFESNIIFTRGFDGRTVAKTFNPSMLDELRTDLGIRPSDALLKGGGNCAILVEGNTEEDGFPIFMEMLGLSEFKLGIAIINLRGCDSEKVINTARLLLAYDIPCVVVLDRNAQKAVEDVQRAAEQGELSNVRKVFRLQAGNIEDYYPLEIVAEVINREFKPAQQVSASDFDSTRHGKERLSDFRRVMHEKGAGTAMTYFKRQLGRTGTQLMKEAGMPVPDEIQTILREVESVVREGLEEG